MSLSRLPRVLSSMGAGRIRSLATGAATAAAVQVFMPSTPEPALRFAPAPMKLEPPPQLEDLPFSNSSLESLHEYDIAPTAQHLLDDPRLRTVLDSPLMTEPEYEHVAREINETVQYLQDLHKRGLCVPLAKSKALDMQLKHWLQTHVVVYVHSIFTNSSHSAIFSGSKRVKEEFRLFLDKRLDLISDCLVRRDVAGAQRHLEAALTTCREYANIFRPAIAAARRELEQAETRRNTCLGVAVASILTMAAGDKVAQFVHELAPSVCLISSGAALYSHVNVYQLECALARLEAASKSCQETKCMLTMRQAELEDMRLDLESK
eukprot:m.30754 g.30754  ORF g.30754 m.30754 type:complete len:321 (-) comp9326_c0_seq1:403-1365(-)